MAFELGGNEKFAFVGDLIPGVCGGVIMLELSFEEEVTDCPDPEVLFIELLREGGSEVAGLHLTVNEMICERTRLADLVPEVDLSFQTLRGEGSNVKTVVIENAKDEL